MSLGELMAWPPDLGPILTLAVILLFGAAGGWVARRLRLPAITGNILAGVLLGPSCLKLFRSGAADVQGFQALSVLAMGMITVSIGSHLSYHRIHNALRRIIAMSLLEVGAGTAAVILVARHFGADVPTAVLLGVIAAATAPGTTLALIRETHAKGTFVKTLLSVVALDNILCICLFAIVRLLIADYYDKNGSFPSVHIALGFAVLQFTGSLAIGVIVGRIALRMLRAASFHNFSTIFVAVMFCTGLSYYFHLSPLLTSLFFGICLGNDKKEVTEDLASLAPIEPILFICFFTMAGASLHVESLMEAGVLCGGYVAARALGKWIGAALGGIVTRSSVRLWTSVPLALVPQAGVAIGLIVLLQGDAKIPETISKPVAAVVLAAVAVNEIIGPLFTRLAIVRSGEGQKDRPRLMDFLHEEFILTNLSATDKWDAIRQLTDFMALTHRLDREEKKLLLESVIEREKASPTAIGKGIAIPHGRIEDGHAIRGVLGICPGGVPFDAPDGAPVKIIAMIATPADCADLHVKVMGSLSAIVSNDMIRTRLITALDANDAWEVIESKETRDYNYFLEDV